MYVLQYEWIYCLHSSSSLVKERAGMEIYIEEENGKVLAGEIRLKRQIQGGSWSLKRENWTERKRCQTS